MFKYNNNEYDIKDAVGVNRAGFAEISFLEILRDIVPNHSTMIDIGANVGNHSIFFEHEMGAQKIYAFEPIKNVFDVMMSNFIQNNSKCVDTYNIALSSKNKELQCISKMPKFHGSYWLWYDDEDYTHPYDMGYKGHNNCNGDVVTETIISKPLSDIIIKEQINLIKIDVEGMELEVLKGAMDIIRKDKPVLQIEVCVNNIKVINDMLTEIGYTRHHRNIFKSMNQLWISS